MDVTEYIRASNGDGEAVRAVVVEQRDVGQTIINVDSVLNWPQKFIATSGTVDFATGLMDESTITVFYGTLYGSMINIEEFAPGYEDNGHLVEQLIVIKPTTPWADAIAEALIEGGGGGASVTIGDTPPPDAEPGDLWGDTSDSALNSIVVAVGSLLMPIGHTIITNTPANPATYYGFGTWEEDVEGRTIVGIDPSQTEFDTVNKTGGHKDMQEHDHGGSTGSTNIVPTSTSTAGAGTGVRPFVTGSGTWVHGVAMRESEHTHSIASDGTGDSGNLQPYQVKYVWTRVA